MGSGSQVNFVSKRVTKRIQLPSKRMMLPINNIGSSTTQSTSSIDIYMKSSIENFVAQINCYILPVIVEEVLSVKIPKEGWKIPKEYTSLLANPSWLFCESGPIYRLIGSGIFFELI